MRPVTKIELYNSQTTDYLTKLSDSIESNTDRTKRTINYILECREQNIQPLNCEWTCDGSCRELCKNRT